MKKSCVEVIQISQIFTCMALITSLPSHCDINCTLINHLTLAIQLLTFGEVRRRHMKAPFEGESKNCSHGIFKSTYTKKKKLLQSVATIPVQAVLNI